MQKPVLEPRLQKEVRDIAKGGEIAGIPVCDQAPPNHESLSGWEVGTVTPREASRVVFARCAASGAEVTPRGPSEQVRPASRA